MELLDTDTEEQKAEKLKMQQGLSDWYDTQGRKLYESEKMADIIAQREKAGQAVTPDMLAAMSGARKAELDTRTKQSEAQSKLAAELASDKNKYLVDMAKMLAQDNRAVLKASGSKSTSGGAKGEVASIKDSQEVRDYVIEQVSAPGFSWAGNSDIDTAVRKLDALGVDKDMAKMAMSGGIKKTKLGLDTTFDLEEFNKNLPNAIQLASDIKAKKGGSGSYSASYGSQSVPNPGIDVLQELYQDAANQAKQAQAKAGSYLVDPDTARAQAAKLDYDKYVADLLSRASKATATSSAAKPTEANVSVAPTSMSSVTERVQEGTPRYPAMNKTFTNEELAAMEADIAAMRNQPRTSPVQVAADTSRSIMSPEARTARGAAVVNTINEWKNQPSRFKDIEIGAPSLDQIRKMIGSEPNKQVAAPIVMSERDQVIQSIANDSRLTKQAKYESLLDVGMSVAAAKKLSGYR